MYRGSEPVRLENPMGAHTLNSEAKWRIQCDDGQGNVRTPEELVSAGSGFLRR